jgi:hypothetical protein
MARKINVELKKITFDVELQRTGASGFSGYSGYSGQPGVSECPIYTEVSGESPNKLTKMAYKDKDSDEWILSTKID